MDKKIIVNTTYALIIYVLLLFRFGYEFGGSDQVEVLPFALYLNDINLFSRDLFIQAAASISPNERWFIVHLVNLVPEQFLYEWCLVLHLFFSLLLILGLRKIASVFIKNEMLQWLAVLVNLVLLYLYAPGANELYYNCLIASLTAKAIGAWAIYYFLKDRFILSILILIPTTWLHPIVGLHIATLFFIGYAINNFSAYKKHVAIYFKALLVYLLFAFSFVLLVKFKTDLVQLNYSLTNNDFYTILFDYRNPHHFNPFAFSIKSFLVTISLLAFALYGFRNEKTIFRFISIAILLFAIATINALWFKNVFVASLQFFKIAIWLKYFGVVGTFVIADKLLRPYFSAIEFKNQALISISAFVIITSYYFTSEQFKLYFDNHTTIPLNEEADISIKAKSISNEDAIFLHPFNFTKFLYYSKRSSYVNFKAIVREKNYIDEWQKRLQFVYNISALNKEKGFDLASVADKNYRSIDYSKVLLLKQKGITHIITDKEGNRLSFEMVAENRTYIIYKL